MAAVANWLQWSGVCPADDCAELLDQSLADDFVAEVSLGLQVTMPETGPIPDGLTVQPLLNSHAGDITGLAACRRRHQVVTAGADGCVKAYDYR